MIMRIYGARGFFLPGESLIIRVLGQGGFKGWFGVMRLSLGGQLGMTDAEQSSVRVTFFSSLFEIYVRFYDLLNTSCMEQSLIGAFVINF